MASFRIEFARSAEKDLRGIDRHRIPQILEAIEGLQTAPRPPGYCQLTGSERTYRIRVGDYRVIYEIEDTVLIVLVIPVRHRKDVYR